MPLPIPIRVRAFAPLGTLLSSRRQEELTELLDRVLALPAVADLNPDTRTRRVHYDWMEAGEHTPAHRRCLVTAIAPLSG